MQRSQLQEKKLKDIPVSVFKFTRQRDKHLHCKWTRSDTGHVKPTCGILAKFQTSELIDLQSLWKERNWITCLYLHACKETSLLLNLMNLQNFRRQKNHITCLFLHILLFRFKYKATCQGTLLFRIFLGYRMSYTQITHCLNSQHDCQNTAQELLF